MGVDKRNFHLYIPQEIKDQFKKKCARNYVNMSDRIRTLIHQDLKNSGY